jgi:DNA polymerase-3 subunit delta
MNYKDFMKELLQGDCQGVYLFETEEEYLKESIFEASKSLVQFTDFNYIDIKEKSDYENIKTAFETYPVMEEKKYIIRRNIDLSKNSIKEYSDILDNLVRDLKDFPDFVALFIFSDNKPFKGKFYKEVKKYGKIVTIERLNNKELTSFIGKRFTRSKKKIQLSLIDEIIKRFSYLSKNSEIDLYDVVNTVDKIISNSKEELVKKEDVLDQLDQVLNVNIFSITDNLSQRNPSEAIKVFLHMEEAGEDLFMIYHMIIRQVRNLIGVKVLSQKSYNESYMMKNLGIGSFELRKLKSFVRNFKLEELFQIHDFLYIMDAKQKSEDFDMSLNLLILMEKFR